MACGLIDLLLISSLIIVVALEVDSRSVSTNSSCDTPTGEKGTCVPVRDCPRIVKVLATVPKPVPPEIKKHLRQYNCDVSNIETKVCCPSGPVVISPKFGTVIPDAPDVTTHENINLLPKKCGRLETNDKIINGQNTSLYEFPWMTLLAYNTPNGPDFRCAGTVINSRYILTAAHCLHKTKYPLISVRVGDHDVSRDTDCQTFEDEDYDQPMTECAPSYQDIPIEEIIIHESYNPTLFTHDIGLIRVSQNIDLTKQNAKPICLPLGESRNYNFTAKNVIVTGWGFTEKDKRSPLLLKVEVPFVDLKKCQEIYVNREVPIIYTQICAGGRDYRDSCTGDSGGPLQVADYLYGDIRYVQQGIVSYGPTPCGQRGKPGIYTKVAHYMDWILNKITP